MHRDWELVRNVHLIITEIIYAGFIVLESGLQIIIPSKSITTRHRYSLRVLQISVNLCPLFPLYSDLDFSQGLEARWKILFSSLTEFLRKNFTSLEPENTRWFKYDRDTCGLFTHKSVPVIFEPPCNFKIQPR